MTCFKRAALAAWLLVGASCSFKGTGPVSEGTQAAPFEILPVTAQLVEDVQSHPVWGLTTERAWRLAACAIDRATRQPMAEEAFTLEKGKKQIPLKADANGCVYWTESLAFEPLAHEHFVRITRTLHSSGGKAILPLVLNPWGTGPQSFADTRTLQSPPQGIVAEADTDHALRGTGPFAPSLELPAGSLFVDALAVETVGASARDSEDTLEYALSGRISTVRYLRDGSPVDAPLPRGKFQARLTVLEKRAGGDTDVLSQSQPFEVNVAQGLLQGNAGLVFRTGPEPTSQLLLAFELHPEAAAFGIAPLFGLKPMDTLRKPGSAAPILDPKAIEQARTALQPAAGVKMAAPNAGAVSGFFIDSTTGGFNGERKADDSRNTLEAAFAARVRLGDALTRQPIAQHPFEVLVADSPQWPQGVRGEIALTTAGGELRVQSHVPYNDLHTERYFEKYVLVRSPRAPYQGVVRSARIWINPWQRGELFYRDAALQGEPRFQPQGSARLVLPGYSAVFLEKRYEVNAQLELTTLRHYSLNLLPGIEGPNAAGTVTPRPLRPGTRLKLQAFLVDPAAPAADPLGGLLSAFETEAEVEAGGYLNTSLVFAVSFTDQPRLDSRTRVHLQLSPADEGPTALAAQLSAPFVPNPNGNDTTQGQTVHADRVAGAFPSPPPQEAMRAIATPEGRVLTPRIDWEASPLELYARYWKGYGPLTQVTLDEKTAPGAWVSTQQWVNASTQQRLKPLFDFVRSDGSSTEKASRAVTAAFCELPGSGLELDAATKSRCLEAPEDFFHLSHFTMVDSIEDSVPRLKSVYDPFLVVAASFFNETQAATRTSHGDKDEVHWISGMQAKVGYEMFANGVNAHTSLNKELEWYRVVEASHGESTRNRVSVVEQITLSGEAITFDISARVRRCALVRPLRFAQTLTLSGESIPSVLVCDSAFSTVVSESWYSVRDRWNTVHSAHSDPRNPLERGWTRLMRGDRVYKQFKDAIGDKTRSFVFSKKIEPFFDSVDSLSGSAFYTPKQLDRLRKDGGLFPGLVQFSEGSSLKWPEAQIARYTELCVEPIRASAGGVASVLEQGAVYCRCLSESAARRWDHEEYLSQVKRFNQALAQDGTRDRCLRYARTGG